MGDKSPDLFISEAADSALAHVSLSRRMRPGVLDDYVGQSHILAPGKLLRRAIETDRIFSIILYGPPGVGKTSLGHVVAGATRSTLVMLNAVEAGVGDLRTAVAEARARAPRRTILFIDEVHRFNKAQQDVLLAPLENDVVTMIGATVENPFFYLNHALLSRVQVFELRALGAEDIAALIDRALEAPGRGLGDYRVDLEPEAREYLAVNSLGDARKALNALELAVLSTTPDGSGTIRIDAAAASECLARRVVMYDRDGDSHYDVASAFIKSVRASQPDAALTWLARMMSGGEDPRFIARRLVISASEDIGMADPRALLVAVAAARATEMIGMPESAYALAEATVYLATAPKSRSCADAVSAAMGDAETGDLPEVPERLRDAGYAGARRLGHGAGYKMPASEAEGRSDEYAPGGKVYYRPGENGYEREVRERLSRWDGVPSDARADDEE